VRLSDCDPETAPLGELELSVTFTVKLEVVLAVEVLLGVP
jgi:hypothetical protein